MIIDLIKNSSKALAVLIDPDKAELSYLNYLIENDQQFDFYLVGGSLVSNYKFDEVCQYLKEHTQKPVILFPGNGMHVSKEADAILFLSLISGRNPEYLIGQQVLAAPRIKQAKLESIGTGYMLFDGGSTTTANYISNTLPIPKGKTDIATATAIAGEMLGLNALYLDTGSGALDTVEPETISEIRKHIDLPIIVGGGVQTPNQAKKLWDSGASIVVIGTALETKRYSL